MLLELLFPRRCLFCGRVLASGEKDLCLPCMVGQRYNNSLIEKYDYLITEMPYEHLDIFLNYNKCKEAIINFKYRQNIYSGRKLGGMWARHLESMEWMKDIDAIVPVPLHWRKLLKRGFNQSEYLGRILSKQTGKPLVTNAIRRHVNNNPQVESDNRWDNVDGIFSAKDLSLIANKHILIVDDVITTSATINNLLKVIKKAKNTKVSLAFLSSNMP